MKIINGELHVTCPVCKGVGFVKRNKRCVNDCFWDGWGYVKAYVESDAEE